MQEPEDTKRHPDTENQVDTGRQRQVRNRRSQVGGRDYTKDDVTHSHTSNQLRVLARRKVIRGYNHLNSIDININST